MKSTAERIEKLLEAGDVKRLHVVRILRPYPVAEHVYGAQVIAAELARLNGVPVGPVLFALLYHDAAEVETGDVPANVKRGYAAVKAVYESLEEEFAETWALPGEGAEVAGLTPTGRAIVKAADRLDCAFRCLVERRMGNRTPTLQTVFTRLLNYVLDYREVSGVEELRTYLAKEWYHVG